MTEALGEHYEISGELARDDMARVVTATDTRTRAAVTVVVVDSRATLREDLVDACFKEARSAAESAPEAALQLIETEHTEGGETFLVHEALEGWTNLASALSKGGALPLHEAAQLAHCALDCRG